MSRFKSSAQVGAIAMALALLAVSCGDSESTAGGGDVDGAVASATEQDATTSGPDTGESTTDELAVDEVEAPTDVEDAFALFDDCMSEAGFELLTNFGDGEGAITIGDADIDGSADTDPQVGPPSLDDYDPEAFQEANSKCGEHLQGVDAGFDLSPEQEAAFDDAQLAFTDCMSDLGVEIPEFEGESNGGVIIVEGTSEVEVDPQTGQPSFGDEDFDFEKFNEAAEECEKVYADYEELDGLFETPAP